MRTRDTSCVDHIRSMLRRNGLSELDHGALAIVLIALSGFPTLLAAQPARFAVDVSVGSGGGIGGRYGDRGQYDGAITITIGGRSFVSAVNPNASTTLPLTSVGCGLSG